jgi:hypothetical protein
MVKYYADQEITNIYDNLQIVWSQFFYQYATIRLYSVYFKYLLVYRYLDLLPTNMNK